MPGLEIASPFVYTCMLLNSDYCIKINSEKYSARRRLEFLSIIGTQ